MNNYELKNSDFEKISKLIYEQCGINLHDGKKELVKARLGKRLRAGNYNSFSDYCHYVTTSEGTDELIAMIDSISTNLTSFFREESHFVRLRLIISSILEKDNCRGYKNRFKIWSAGCSTGEEPYTLAITVKEAVGQKSFEAMILATDISTKVLRMAEAGIYPHEKIKNIATPILKKYFQIGTGQSEGHYRVKNELKSMIDFQRFNLMHKFPAQSQFDIVFCRNVMIYFDKQTQGVLVNKFYDSLNKGGYFFVGHSESLTGLNHQFNYIEPSVYQK
jgi:chemotaxis protein methyltransferase CheR